MVFGGTAQVREISQIWLTSRKDREGKYEPSPWFIEVSPLLLLPGLLIYTKFPWIYCFSAPMCCFLEPPKTCLLCSTIPFASSNPKLLYQYLFTQCLFCFLSQPVNGALQATLWFGSSQSVWRTSLMRGSWGNWDCLLGEKEAQGRPYHCLQLPERRL